jgi:hypothetical protein
MEAQLNGSTATAHAEAPTHSAGSSSVRNGAHKGLSYDWEHLLLTGLDLDGELSELLATTAI